MTIKEILKITNGRLLSNRINENLDVKQFYADTNQIKKGTGFIGIKGDKVDGNDLYDLALKNGASVCILEKEPKEIENNIIIVDNTIKCMQELAKFKRTQYDCPVIGITGSVGKTSTKDMISSVLLQKYNVHKTIGNHNNQIGVPITLLSMNNENCLVVEMGMNHFGEISKLTNIAKPTIAVITNIGTAHIGILGSRENILKAKLEILEGLQSRDVVINNDNDLLSKWAKENSKKYNIITYGIKNKDSQYVAENIETFEDKSEFILKGTNYKIKVPIGGEHFILNSLCSIAVGKYLGITYDEIVKGIEKLELTNGRMEKIISKSGAIIINDSYNANYDSMTAALKYLRLINDKRKIAVLGDMKELGKYENDIHKKVGIESKGIDILITIGDLGKIINENSDVKEKYHFDTNEEASQKIKSLMNSNDIILLKASNSMNFKQILEKIKES